MKQPSIQATISKLSAMLSSNQKWQWGMVMALALLVSLLEMITASVIVVFAKIMVDVAAATKYFAFIGWSSMSHAAMIVYASFIFGAVYLCKNLIATAEIFYQNFTIQKMAFEFKTKLLQKYAKSDYGFYLTRNSSFGMQVVGGDAEQTFSQGMTSLAGVISESIVFLGLVSMIVVMDPSLAVGMFSAATLIGFILFKYVLPTFYQFGLKLQNANVSSHRTLTQLFHGYKEISLFGKRQIFSDLCASSMKVRSSTQAIQSSLSALPRVVLESLFVGVFVAAICYLGLDGQGTATMLGTLAAYLYVGFRLMPALNRMISHLSTFKSTIPAIDRVYQELNTLAAMDTTVDIPELTFLHEITIRDMGFRYLNTDRNVLKNINLTIKKGETVGFVGETGSGKSTLIDLILGLLRPTEGSIQVDGIYPVNSKQWHKKIGYVPQTVYLIDDTIAANIAFGVEDFDPIKMKRAIDAAQLSGFIDKLPDKTQTLVGERGVRLSGGERQRVAIARALYHSPDILIFDEATSALDNETEARLMKTIESVSQDRTVIMIAHRLTTLDGCDRIVSLEEGLVKKVIALNNLEKKSLEDLY